MSTKPMQKWLAAIATGMYMAASSTAYADDTDIFFNTQYRDTTKPNILFIVDTSGSMAWQQDGSPTEPYTTTPSRMTIVRNAMVDLLDTVNRVNVGLSRFTNPPGGPILMPIRDIDGDLEDGVLPMVSSTINAGSDDARQAGTTVTLGDTPLEMSGTAWVGLRFNSLDIPRGATISKALVSLSSTSGDTGAISYRIFGQAAGNATTFTTASNNITGRTRTTAYRDWTPGAWVSNGRHSTADIANIIQEITSRSDWCGGNSVVILIRREGTGTGRRRLRSFESDSQNNNMDFERPTLNVQFQRTLPDGANGCYTGRVIAAVSDDKDDVVENADAPHGIIDNSAFFKIGNTDGENGGHKAVGLRFANFRVPKNATILDSKLSFYNNSGSDWAGNTTVAVQAVNANDFDGFEQEAEYLTGTALEKTTALNLTFPAWNQNTIVGHSGNLNTVVSAITNRAGWVAGNDLGLVLTYVSGTIKHASSYEGGHAPTLTVRYQSDRTSWRFTVRDAMKVAANQLFAIGNTPLADTLAEAALYYRGEEVLYGLDRGDNNRNYKRISSTTPGTMTGGTHSVPNGCDPVLDPFNSLCAAEAITGTPTYVSPIDEPCQSHHIVYLTDGEPTSHDSDTDAVFTRLWEDAGETGVTCPDNNVDDDPSNIDDGVGAGCLVGLADFLHSQDQSNDNLNQTVNTHFIGFNIDLPLLDVAANAGGTGGAKLATDAASLAAAFSNILANISTRSGTYVSAGVSVNQANRLTHLDQLYFAMFEPDVAPRWAGNLKRYRLNEDGVIVDANDVAAVRTDADQFVNEARSFWSETADGRFVRRGGSAAKLSNSRPLYTNLAGTTNELIIATGNRVHEDTTGLTTGILAVSETERTKVLQWARGVDVLDEAGPDTNGDGKPEPDGNLTGANQVFGDPLHSRPTLINYKVGGDADGELRVYVGTNRGELHSISPETDGTGVAGGVEQWAFVPKDLLPNYRILMENEDAVAKRYGLDGSIVPYLKDTNRDGMIDKNATGADAEKAILYVGMRRGGNNYYAIDVTDPDAPRLKFTIRGGSGDYAKLSQTWSQPVIAKTKLLIGSTLTEKTVMIFGGGYSVAQDTATVPVNDSVGNAVFIADADTGALLWSSDEIDGLGMNKSVPADIAAIDLNVDGFVDHFYAADMGAQIWRFDIRDDGTITAGATPGPLARFQDADTETEANNRRFYGGMDVSLIQRDNGTSYVVVAVGSGFREKPLDTAIDDHFYVFRDEGVFDNTIIPLTLDNLVDITNLFGDAAAAAAEEEGKYGWYLNFETAGEKNLTAPVIFNNTVLFTTYIVPEEEACEVGEAGSGRFYAISIFNGSPLRDSDGDGLSDEPRYADFTNCPTCGMVPPQLLFTDDDVIGLIGTKTVDVNEIRERVKRVKWRHNRQ